MNKELHSDPSMGHKKKGSEAMKEAGKAPFHMTRITHHDDGSHTVEHEPHIKPSKGGAFLERGDAKSYSAGDGNELMSKLKQHLGIGAAPSPKTEKAEMDPSESEESEEGE